MVAPAEVRTLDFTVATLSRVYEYGMLEDLMVPTFAVFVPVPMSFPMATAKPASVE